MWCLWTFNSKIIVFFNISVWSLGSVIFFCLLSWQAYASGCDVVILGSDFERLQIIPGAKHGNIQVGCVDCSLQGGQVRLIDWLSATCSGECVMRLLSSLSEGNHNQWILIKICCSASFNAWVLNVLRYILISKIIVLFAGSICSHRIISSCSAVSFSDVMTFL